jgi:hypothetical protein
MSSPSIETKNQEYTRSVKDETVAQAPDPKFPDREEFADPRAAESQSAQSGTYADELHNAALEAGVSDFHYAGLILAQKNELLTSQDVEKILTKVGEGSLSSEGVDSMLIAAFKDKEKFQQVFNTDPKGNVAAVFRDMDQEIMAGLNSASWGTKEYADPIMAELYEIQNRGLGDLKSAEKSPESKPAPEPEQEEKPDKKPTKTVDSSPDKSPDTLSSEARVGEVSKVLAEIGVIIAQGDPGMRDQVPLYAEYAKQTSKDLLKIVQSEPDLTTPELFYLGMTGIETLRELGSNEELPPEVTEKVRLPYVMGLDGGKERLLMKGEEITQQILEKTGSRERGNRDYSEAAELESLIKGITK